MCQPLSGFCQRRHRPWHNATARCTMRHMSDTLRREIARVLQAEREAAGLSHADLAARAGVNAATLARIERGTHAPSLDMVERLLAALGVQPVLSTEPLDDLDA